MNQSSFFASKLHTMIAVTVLLITLLISPALAGVLDDDVPREKAKMPKLKPPLWVLSEVFLSFFTIAIFADISILYYVEDKIAHDIDCVYIFVAMLYIYIICSQLPEVTHKVYLDVGEFYKFRIIIYQTCPLLLCVDEQYPHYIIWIIWNTIPKKQL